MTRPSAREAWRQVRASGIGVDGAERLRSGAPLEVLWTPPIRLADGPLAQDIAGHRFTFRLHQQADGWIVEGTDGGPWEVCEGPIMDAGRPPWLARPKDIGGQP